MFHDGPVACINLSMRSFRFSCLVDSHQLNRVVAKVSDSWENIASELFVCANLGLRRRDADWATSYARIRRGTEADHVRLELTMGFINLDCTWLRWPLVFELVLLRRVPENGIIDGRDLQILDHTTAFTVNLNQPRVDMPGLIILDLPNPCRYALNAFATGHSHGDLSVASARCCSSVTIERLLTLTLELWGMAGFPFTGGIVISYTPNWSLVIL